jgi:hypothetical protein
MKAYFGDEGADEYTSPRNGLLLHYAVEEAMDDGAITIVPDLPPDPSPAQVQMFHLGDPRNYRWRVVDPSSVLLNELVAQPGHPGTDDDEAIFVRDLDGRRLHFRNDARPGARYCCWIFCAAVLKMAWKLENRQVPKASCALLSRLGKGVWASVGDYMSESFLSALATELGHDASVFDAEVEPDRVGMLGLAKMFQFRAGRGVGSDDDEDEEDDDE